MINPKMQLNTVDDRTWFYLFIIFVYTFIGLFVGQFLGIALIIPFFDFDIAETITSVSDFSPQNSRIPLLIVQGVSAICAFIIAPWYFLKKHSHQSVSSFVVLSDKLPIGILLVFGITISFMFANSVLIEWNQSLVFPEWMSGFEAFAQSQEEMREKATIFLTSFSSVWVFLLTMVIIAFVPAFGEELLFRGVIQNLIHIGTKNAHVAIWVSATLFSLFHFQFYGFIPRLMLGALFGYLYFWSGSLLYAFLGHFINNGFTLLMLFLHQRDLITFDIQGTESIPLETVVFFLIIGTSLVYLYIRFVSSDSKISTDG